MKRVFSWRFLPAIPMPGMLFLARAVAEKYAGAWRVRAKGGAVRVIYTTQLACGAIVALLIYGKGATENIPAHILYKIAKEMNHATH
ncbi:hypothetical protein FIV39_00155 [Pseudomonas grimontii]|uniref:Uncharacterized protein n=1 Tax=Pseudomonas grimontii TaxID=129847 RepID=A0A5C5PMH6_9PSED|nr:hypothetical protein FIV39_00155 [Pseudomonas grimontii]